ncbi:DUF3298 and DUF4163 domain-containing protein [Clostridium sp. Ade.TY]|uniref:DUF3298 and DUF4163 domain-containing protein n=1 Tax=Clostridium sp. Ade.TY TaxID=1391647 RepID=UPI000421D597|nr:DUF3298 and DUF4163 domain-containing protein [Clostridium sp. Ade.TY]
MKKLRIIKASAVMLISFLITNFAQGMWITSFGDTNQLENNKFIIENKINENNECIEVNVSYPQLIPNTLKLINNEIKWWTDNWINDVKSILEDYKKSGYICNMKYELFSKFFVTLERDDLLSFYIDYYQFTGGAHGLTTRRAYTLDVKNGNKLKIKNLFKNGYDYKSFIDKEIKKQVDANKEKYFEGLEGFNGINDEVKFYINGDNLVIYYGQYEIAPYASGIPEFNIPIQKFDGNFLYGKIK